MDVWEILEVGGASPIGEVEASSKEEALDEWCRDAGFRDLADAKTSGIVVELQARLRINRAFPPDINGWFGVRVKRADPGAQFYIHAIFPSPRDAEAWGTQHRSDFPDDAVVEVVEIAGPAGV